MTLATTVKQELEISLDSALMLAGPNTTVPDLANRIYDMEPDLIGKIQREWIIERLMGMLYKKRAHMPAEGQYVLPGFYNFPNLMTLKDGSRLIFIQGNFTQLLEFRDVLQKRRRPRLAVIKKFITLMAPYAEARSTITVGEVILLERAKQG